MPDEPDLNFTLRDLAFEEIRRVASLIESYSRSIGEAAFRDDQRTVLLHLHQLRSCVLAMIRSYKFALEGTEDGQGVPAAQPAHDAGQDQRPGDGVA